MYRKKTTRKSVSGRQPRQTVGESFRRNNVVFSRSQKELVQRQQSVTQRRIERKRSLKSRKLKFKIIFIITASLLMLLASRMGISQISTNSNASSKLTSEQKALYEASWMEYYKANSPLGQYWLLDKEAFEQAILQEYPEIEDINISASVPVSNVMNVDVRFRRAVFTWKDASGSVQFVDKNGVLFSKDHDASVDLNKLTSIEDQSGTVLEPGNPVLTTNLIAFVGQLHQQIKTVYTDKSIAKVIIPRSTREVQIQIQDTPYYIKFSSQRPLEDQISELATLVNYLNTQNIQPASYIDIRVSQKAFYK